MALTERFRDFTTGLLEGLGLSSVKYFGRVKPPALVGHRHTGACITLWRLGSLSPFSKARLSRELFSFRLRPSLGEYVYTLLGLPLAGKDTDAHIMYASIHV